MVPFYQLNNPLTFAGEISQERVSINTLTAISPYSFYYKQLNIKTMGKIKSKGSTFFVDNESELKKFVHEINEQGNTFGNTIVEILSMTADSPKGIASAAIGLAKAMAAAKGVAHIMDVPFEAIYEDQLQYFEADVEDIFNRTAKKFCSKNSKK